MTLLRPRPLRWGFDVIECPDFWEQPETITFDPDRVKIQAVYGVVDDQEEFFDEETGEWIDDYDLIEELKTERDYYERGSANDYEVDKMGEYGLLRGPLYRAEDDSPPSAITNRQQSAIESQPPDDRIADALKGLLGKQECRKGTGRRGSFFGYGIPWNAETTDVFTARRPWEHEVLVQ